MTAEAMSSASRAPVGLVVEERRVDHAGLDQGDLDRGVVVHLPQLLAQ